MWKTRRDSISMLVSITGCALLVLCQRNVDEPVGGILAILIFLGTVLGAGIVGGWKPGVGATLLAMLAGTFFFSPSYLSRMSSKPIDVLRFLTFGFLGVSLSAFCELLQRAWRRIEDRQRRLEEEVQERRRAQIAEHTRADELMTTLASIGDGVIRTDNKGQVTFLNPVAEELVGWTTSEASGRKLSKVFQVISEATRQPIENPVVRALRNGTVVRPVNHSILISRDGKERLIDDSAAPIREATGKIVGSVLIFRDIGERQRSQAALRESESRFRALMEQAPFSIQAFSPDGRVLRVNRAWEELWGGTLQQLGDYNVLDDGQLEAKGVLDDIRRGFAGETVYVPAIEYDPIEAASDTDIFRDHRRWVSTVIYPIKDNHGRIQEVVFVHHDVTDGKRAEVELRDADRRKDEFLATLAHELRNPLAPITNSLEILKLPEIDAQIAQQTRDVIERQVQQLVRLVDDLLDVSRVMRGKIELRLAHVELATVVARAVETARPLIDAQGHRLEISLPSSSIPLNVDPVRLAQVIGNLLTNSAKYTERNGLIRLSAKQDGDQVILSVQDNGIGIAPEMLPQIFELFVQVDHSSTKSQGGLGIGLTLVRNLVEMHGGTVEAKSAGLGCGSRFMIRLPLSTRSEARQTESDPAHDQRSPATSGLRLLVIDDNQDAANSLAMLLRMQGHEARVANSGAGALETVATYIPDLVLLDIGMPVMDGYEVSRRLRKTPGLEKTVVAALTGWGQPEDRKRTEAAGFDHHLVKPLEPQALAKVLADLKRSIT